MPLAAKGLEGIVANTTRLSDVIGDKGQLIYCGYDINELAGKVSYEEVVYLLWNNRLPTRAELDDCDADLLRGLRQLAGGRDRFHQSRRRKMPTRWTSCAPAISMLGLYDRDAIKDMSPEANRERARSITAKIGVIAAYFHRARQGKSLAAGARGSRAKPRISST